MVRQLTNSGDGVQNTGVQNTGVPIMASTPTTTFRRPSVWALLALLGLSPSSCCSGTILRPSTPPMGFSTWNNFHGAINETLIKQVGEALRSSGLQALGYRFVNLDDEWAAEQRNATGHIAGDPTRFPGGMAALGGWLHARNLSFGLYTSRAARTCSGRMPGSLGHEALDAATFAAYGADFIKNDDCGVVYARAAADYGAMQAAIAAAPRAMMHNVKAPDLPAAASAAVCQLRRVGKDLKNTWGDLVRVLDTGTAPAFGALVGPGRGFFNDFDSLEVGSRDGAGPHDASPPLTAAEQRAHFSLWAALKAPLLLGNDPRRMSAGTLSILGNTEVIAVNQDAAVAPALLVSRAAAPPAAAAAAAASSSSPPTKTVMRPCDAGDASQRWVIDGDGKRIRSAPSDSSNSSTSSSSSSSSSSGGAGTSCLTLWQCLQRWPWWLASVPCVEGGGRGGGLAAGTAGASCSVADQQSFALNATSGRIVWAPVAAKPDGCWGSPGGGCCLSVEGANPELDKCGWSEDPTRQQWAFRAVGSGGGGGGGGGGDGEAVGMLVSAFHDSGAEGRGDLCLALAQDLEVYAGPLWGGRSATAVLFNRSPAAANITLDIGALASAGFLPAVPVYEVRDLWRHEDLGLVRGSSFTAEVESHGVVHVNVMVPL